MQLLIGILYAWALVDAVLSAFFLLHSARRRIAPEYRIFGLLCALQALYALATAQHYAAVGLHASARWSLLRVVIVTPASALFVDFLSRIAGLTPRPRRLIAAAYGCAALGILFALADMLAGGYHVALRTVRLFGASVALGEIVPDPLTSASFTGLAIVGIVVFVRTVRAAWRGDWSVRVAAGAAIGVEIASIIDGVAWSGRLGWISLGEHAFFAFAFLMAFVLTARLAEEVAVRTGQVVQLDATLRTARAALERNGPLAAIGEMSAIVAHELRNPLAVITNAVASLGRAEVSLHDRDTLLRILGEESVRMNRTVTDLLQLARPIATEPRMIHAATLLARVARSSRDEGARVILRPATDAGARFVADEHLLRQALENLVDNALQATGPGGAVTVSLAASARDGSAGWEFSVADTGEGMSAEVFARARDAFFTTRPSGTGLGLAIVDRIVRAHGGAMDIESARGAGTTVRLWIPAPAAMQRQAS